MGSNVLFPFSVGASCVLFPERSTPETRVRADRAASPDGARSTCRRWCSRWSRIRRRTQQDLSSLRLVDLRRRSAARRAVRRAGSTRSASSCSTASAPPRCGTSSSPTGRAPSCPARSAPAVDGFEVKLCDDEGREVPDGEVGALWVKGDSRAIGYWQRLDDTMHAFRGEWYVSGDMLQQESPTARSCTAAAPTTCSKSAASGCRRASSRTACCSTCSVREVAVVGVTNADGLVKPCAFVVTDHASDALWRRHLQAFAKSAARALQVSARGRLLDVAAAHASRQGRSQRAGTGRGRCKAGARCQGADVQMRRCAVRSVTGMSCGAAAVLLPAAMRRADDGDQVRPAVGRRARRSTNAVVRRRRQPDRSRDRAGRGPAGATIDRLCRATPALPGLIDAHTHITYYWDRAPGTRPRRPAAAAGGDGVSRAGERAPHARDRRHDRSRSECRQRHGLCDARADRASGAMVGPRIFASGPGLSARAGRTRRIPRRCGSWSTIA